MLPMGGESNSLLAQPPPARPLPGCQPPGCFCGSCDVSFSICSFCRFILFPQAIAAGTRSWLEREASSPKFSRCPTMPGTPMTNLGPVHRTHRMDRWPCTETGPKVPKPKIQPGQPHARRSHMYRVGGDDACGCLQLCNRVNKMQFSA